MRSDAGVQQLVAAFRLGVRSLPVRGRGGELLGRGTGSSLEFQEYREYLPGDDIRHVDWAAYARSDHLMVRLFREEISPELDIIVDGSRSMMTGGGKKGAVAKQVAAALAMLAAQLGGSPRVVFARDDAPLVLTLDSLDTLTLAEFDGERDLGAILADGAIPLRNRSLRVVLTDFLFPHAAEFLTEQFTRGAIRLWFVQLLTEFEANPKTMGGRRMIDAESGTEIDLILDEATVADYRTRLSRTQSLLQRECRRRQAEFVTAICNDGALSVAHRALVPAGLLQPA